MCLSNGIRRACASNPQTPEVWNMPIKISLESHVNSVHSTGIEEQRTTKSTEIHPQSMKVADLKKELRIRGASISGDKAPLIRRLEGILALETN